MKAESPEKGYSVDTVLVRVKGDVRVQSPGFCQRKGRLISMFICCMGTPAVTRTHSRAAHERAAAVCIRKENKCEMDKDINEKITAKSVIF